MSGLILVCHNNKEQSGFSPPDFQDIADSITPDDIEPTIEAYNEPGLSLTIVDPTKCVTSDGASAYVGLLLDPSDNWTELGSGKPDGVFALFRSDESAVELITDSLGQRTIWYAQTEALFIASTSQRAIIRILGDFQPNKDVFPWMLATGSLGPLQSWDKRIKMVPPNSVVALDRTTWQVQLQQERLDYAESGESPQQLEDRLLAILKDTFNRISIDSSDMVLPLSGGYDSRAILMLLQDRKKLSCFTIAPKMSNKYNTWSITTRLAEHYDVPLRFLERNNSDETVKSVFERFLVASEGRIDGISGYQDGFKLFKTLRDEGTQGVIWGDEVFGWKQLDSQEDVKRLLGLRPLSEYENIPELSSLGLSDIEFPDFLKAQPGESGSSWFGRLYQDFRVPHTLSARVDCKSRYLEVLNPLMSRELVKLARELPDEQRQWKRLVSKVVGDMSPDIPFFSSATHDGKFRLPEKNVQPLLWSTQEGVDVILEELDSVHARQVLPTQFIDFLLANLTATSHKPSKIKKSFRSLLASLAPNWLRLKLMHKRERKKAPVIKINELSFRAYLIVRMSKILTQDGNVAYGQPVTANQ